MGVEVLYWGGNHLTIMLQGDHNRGLKDIVWFALYFDTCKQEREVKKDEKEGRWYQQSTMQSFTQSSWTQTTQFIYPLKDLQYTRAQPFPSPLYGQVM